MHTVLSLIGFKRLDSLPKLIDTEEVRYVCTGRCEDPEEDDDDDDDFPRVADCIGERYLDTSLR